MFCGVRQKHLATENTITARTHVVVVADFLTRDEREFGVRDSNDHRFAEEAFRILIDLSSKVCCGFRAESIGSHVALLLDWHHAGIWHKRSLVTWLVWTFENELR
jgi:hypothetical protein